MKPEKYFKKIQNLKFKSFNSKLLPNINEEQIIGVKIPDIKKFAKEYIKDEECNSFLKCLPHKYLEENILHGVLISLNKNVDEVIKLLDEFLPYVDNWCVCDTIKPVIIKKHPDELYKYLKKWIKSKEEYRVRFSIVTLLNFYLDDNFKEEINDLVLNVKSDKYYINMARAWYFSFAIIKQYDSTIPIFEKGLLDTWTNNKAIQKCKESFRVSEERKTILNNYKK